VAGPLLQQVDVVVAEVELADEHGGVLDRAALDEALGPPIRRTVALVGDGHEGDAAPVGGLAEATGVGQIARQRLLDEGRDAALDAGQAVFDVKAVGPEDENAVGPLGVEHRLDPVVPRATVHLGDVTAFALAGPHDGGQGHRFPDRTEAQERGQMLRDRDAAGPDDGQAHGAARGPLGVEGDAVDVALVEHLAKRRMGVGVFEHGNLLETLRP